MVRNGKDAGRGSEGDWRGAVLLSEVWPKWSRALLLEQRWLSRVWQVCKHLGNLVLFGTRAGDGTPLASYSICGALRFQETRSRAQLRDVSL